MSGNGPEVFTVEPCEGEILPSESQVQKNEGRIYMYIHVTVVRIHYLLCSRHMSGSSLRWKLGP